MRYEGLAAWKTAAANPLSRWSENTDRLDDDAVELNLIPKFQLNRSDRVFCLGSCFARNIEEHLLFAGIPVLSKRMVAPKSEWHARPNGIVNKFTTHSMRNEVEFVALGSAPSVDETWFCETEAGWRDLQLIGHDNPVSLERAIERRRYLIGDYFSRLREASFVVLTLGLNEVWHDARQDRFLNTAPPIGSVRRDAGRYSLHVTDVAQNIAALTGVLTSMRSINPAVRVIVTVSPVPMETTFTKYDVFSANTLSKATLRAAAQATADAYDFVDYFPSFEMITLAPRARAFASDQHHVRYASVARIIDLFLRHYAPDAATAHDWKFSEDGYLAANPDVEDLVRSGILESGFEHWCNAGATEGRSLMPRDGPTERMKRQGWV